MKQYRFPNPQCTLRCIALLVFASQFSHVLAENPAPSSGVEGLPESASALEALLLADEPAPNVASSTASDTSAKDAAEATLRAAMPFSFMKADPQKLEPALAAAKLAGVDRQVILAAEEKLQEAKGAATLSTVEAAAQLQAAMPFSFLPADPTKLGTALEAAKLAGVDQSLILDAEAKLREGKVNAEAQLRAAMPFSFMKADPEKLEPALAAAKLAGVDPSAILEAEAKLKSAREASSADDNVVLLIDMPAIDSNAESNAVTTTSHAGEPREGSAKPFLGVGIRDPSNSVVTTLYRDSTAAKLGITLGDAIVSVNGTAVEEIESLRSIIATMSIGSDVTVVIRRDGNEYSVGPLPLGGRHE